MDNEKIIKMFLEILNDVKKVKYQREIALLVEEYLEKLAELREIQKRIEEVYDYAVNKVNKDGTRDNKKRI